MKGNTGLTPSRRKVGNEVDTTSNQWQSNPKQQRFLTYYFDPASKTFSNVFQSALSAGYSESYARTLTRKSNKNMWLTEYLNNTELKQEHIIASVTSIALDPVAKHSDRLRALELVAKLKGLLVDKSITAHVNIEQALSDLK